jgi:hypothetical protein
MRKFAFFIIFPVLIAASVADAAVLRNPTGVNVSTSGPTTLTIRFADGAGAAFTTTSAFFCSEDPTGGVGLSNANMTSCAGVGGVILGRLPAALDRGSTTSSTSSITDIMTIPFSVTRRGVVQARAGQNSDFFYVRRFEPVGGADLGAGAGVPVLVTVTCRLSGGTSRTPLSLTKVVLYGDEGRDADRVLLIRVTPENRETGMVKADINYTGTGLLAGWWEVRTPTDPAIRELDRFTEGSISETQRQEQQRFQRVKRFRLQVPLSGRITLPGPSYKQLSQSSPGVYEILLRVQATRDREALSSLAAAGGSTNLFSGGAAGFPLPVLEYRVGKDSAGAAALSALAPRLVLDKRPDGVQQVAVRWTAAAVNARILRIEAVDPASGKTFKLLAPVKKGFAVIPPEWTRDMDLTAMRYSVTALGSDRQPVSDPILVAR